MFTLLNPSALLALLGLLVPVAIHLWNRRPGREVAVGSLRWLAAGANRRLRNLKPEQLALLLLRAVLLAVLAVAVAQPVWRQAVPGGRGQVLLSPEVLGTSAFAALRPTIDSLRRRGYALRWLAAGFPKVSGAAWRADSLGKRDSVRVLAPVEGPTAAFRWARVQEAAGFFAGQPLYVVSPATLRGLQGAHPPLPATISWQTLPTPGTKTWLQAASLRGDSLHLLLGISSETQTIFRLQKVAKPQAGAVLRVAGGPRLRYETGPAGSQLRPLAASGGATQALPPVAVRTRPLRVMVYFTTEYSSDARYLQAGLRAAATGLPAPLELRVVTSPPTTARPPDWLFWLSDAPLPAAWRAAVSQGTQVWQEAPAPGVADKASFVPGTADEGPATILRRGASAPDVAGQGASFTVWADGLGRAVLSRRVLGKGTFYQLHTRLNPAWSNLADSPALPAQLLTVLQPEPTDDDLASTASPKEAVFGQDQRALDPSQLATKTTSATTALPQVTTAPTTAHSTDLRPWLVLAAGLLFAIERLWARRRAAQALPSNL